MPPIPPTTLAFSDALTHYRQLRSFDLDDLAYVLAVSGHGLTSEDLRRLERAEQRATVDDLTAIAAALDVTPADLLAFVPSDRPVPEGQLATGLPHNMELAELRAWALGRTGLDRESRLAWARDRVDRLRIRLDHVEDQLRGARDEWASLGELVSQEPDAPQVYRLQDRIRDGEHDLSQAEVGLAMAEQRLDELKARR